MALIEDLLQTLSRSDAYPYAVDGVVVHQTHISLVFLAGEFVYKVKKPVQLGFLDFGTLEKRRHFCEEEARLNRRLAPTVYLGVVPIVRGQGGLRVEGEGEPVEWAVKMRRLPAAATLQSRLRRGEVRAEHLHSLAQRLARFYMSTPPRSAGGPHAPTSSGADGPPGLRGGFDTVSQNVRENFEQTAAHQGLTVSETVWRAVRDLSEQFLGECEALMRRRDGEGVPRDTHGDLHLDHVYHFPEEAPPDDWVIIDCIEFNERFRYADPVADMAFLVMDLAFHGRRDLGREFARAYFQAARDPEGERLLPLYSSYRAVVRAKVEGMKSLEREVPAAEREAVSHEAKAHWLLARDELVEPNLRSALLIVCGLPGTGKSTLARALAERANFQWLRSDEIRKELADSETDLYSAEQTETTYREMLRRAEECLWNGGRALLDANFRLRRQRGLVRDLARRWHVPLLFFECRASAQSVRRRLQGRHGDVSDADWSVYQLAAREWEPAEEDEGWTVLDMDADRQSIHIAALAALANNAMA